MFVNADAHVQRPCGLVAPILPLLLRRALRDIHHVYPPTSRLRAGRKAGLRRAESRRVPRPHRQVFHRCKSFVTVAPTLQADTTLVVLDGVQGVRPSVVVRGSVVVGCRYIPTSQCWNGVREAP